MADLPACIDQDVHVFRSLIYGHVRVRHCSICGLQVEELNGLPPLTRTTIAADAARAMERAGMETRPCQCCGDQVACYPADDEVLCCACGGARGEV